MLNITHYQKCKSKPQWGTISYWSAWLPSKSLQTINAGEGVEKRKPSCTIGGKLTKPLWRTVWRFLKKLELHAFLIILMGILAKLKLKLQYDAAIPCLGIHTKETRTERNTRIPMFTAALVTIARTCKQPDPSADEWIRELW